VGLTTADYRRAHCARQAYQAVQAIGVAAVLVCLGTALVLLLVEMTP
jgi:hypothetical protein